MAWELPDKERLARFWLGIKNKLADKYDKSGGEITGSVIIDGNLTLKIEDEDYDAGVRISKSLDDNAGTVITATGYANANGDNTNYKPVMRNFGNPVNDYDLANKRYVDAQVVHPDSYLVFLNPDGSIDTYSSSLTYSKVKGELTSYTTDVYLDVIYGNSRIHIPAIEDQDTNAGPIVFLGSIRLSEGTLVDIVFLLSSDNTLTDYITTRENALLKVTDIASYPTSLLHYPTTKGVWDTFQRKPDVVWEVTDVSQGLNALQANISATGVNWQLTDLDLTPYKRIKVYAKGGQGSTNAGTTGAMIVEILLDPRMAITSQGGHYVGSVLSQKPNDSNRYASLTCAVSADKTKFAVLRQTSLYGTAATTNNDIGASVVLIEGYYD